MITQSRPVAEQNLSAIESDIERIFQAQLAHRISVGRTTARERIKKLRRLHDLTLAHKDEICAAVHADFRKPEAEAYIGEIYPVVSEIRHIISNLKDWMRPRRAPSTLAFFTTSARIVYEPRGVALIIAPWNYPFMLSVGPLAAAIAAGNTAVLKPSEYTPATARIIRKLVAELFPENEVAVVEGDAEVASALLKKPFHHIFFTGSPQVGKVVMRAAAEHLSSVTLELGGKSPAIVDETANLDDAAAKLAFGKFSNNGQSCIAPDYLYVHESRHDALVAKLKERVEKFYGASAEHHEESPHYARIISQRHAERLQRLLNDAVAAGARAEIGGSVRTEDRYVAPTLLTNVTPEMTLMREEIFGPILPILKYNRLDETLDRINAGEKPLALYIFSKNRHHIKRTLEHVSSGGACVNEAMLQFLHPNLPFGGVNNSGQGSAHGFYGFRAFSHERAILKHYSFSPLKLIYPPYTKTVKRLLRLLTHYI